MGKKKLIHDPLNPKLFSNEQLGLPPDDYELREVIKTDEYGRKVRLRVAVKTKEAFIRQAREIWGDQYDYTESEYTDNKSPITIYCPKHDYHFRVAMAQNHILPPKGSTFQPTGCPVCMYEQQYGKQFGPEWRNFLKVSANNSRVGLIHPESTEHKKTAEQIAAEKAEREAKAEAKRREEEAFIKKWHAKDIHEARLIQRIHDKYGDQYDTSLVNNRGKEKPITLICPKHGFFDITPRALLSGIKGTPPHGCWLCEGMTPPQSKMKMSAKEFNRRVRNIYKFKKLTFPIRKKVKANSKVTATCAKHGKITHDVQWWLDGKGCEYCNGAYHPVDCFDNARKVHGDKYQYIGEPPRTGNGIIRYICPKHGEIEQRYDVHVRQGCGCPKCANYPNKKTPLERCNEWIAKCKEKYEPGRYDYSRAHETYVNNDSLVWIRCCIHNKWLQTTPDNILRTVHGSCPICSIEFRESEGEATIRRWLLKHDITNFKFDEVTIPNENPKCKRQYLRPDFWLPDYNLFIEYNGEEHYEDIDFFFDEEFTFEDEQIRDETMRQYCRNHHHNLLEIPYWDFHLIAEILSDVLLKDKTDYSTYYVNRRD